MLTQQQHGFTFIELVIFMVVIGIVATGLLVGINNALRYSNIPRMISKPSFLATARMQVILMNRDIMPFSTFDDPCSRGSPPAICTPLSTYATTNRFTVNTSITGASPTKTITVTVSGAGDATLNTSTYNYANN